LVNTKDGLAGMNTPELDAPYGKKAKRAIGVFCKDLVVTAYSIGEPSYQCIVAKCFLDDGWG